MKGVDPLANLISRQLQCVLRRGAIHATAVYEQARWFVERDQVVVPVDYLQRRKACSPGCSWVVTGQFCHRVLAAGGSGIAAPPGQYEISKLS